jgi:hypothetical protein
MRRAPMNKGQAVREVVVVCRNERQPTIATAPGVAFALLATFAPKSRRWFQGTHMPSARRPVHIAWTR